MVGFAINSAADAIFKCVFGTATVAEEPRDCTVQSASAYKSEVGGACPGFKSFKSDSFKWEF